MTAAALQVCTDIPRHKGLTHTNTHTLGSHASCFIFIKQRLIHPLHSLCIPLLKPKLLQVHSQNDLRYKNWGKHMERSWICVHGLVRESLKWEKMLGHAGGSGNTSVTESGWIRKEPPECFNVYFQSHWSTFIAALLPLRSPKWHHCMQKCNVWSLCCIFK